MNNDLTKGPIWKNILLFSIPLLLTSLFQQLYNTVDLIFAGNILGKSASSAIGVSSLLVTCLIGFFSGMSVGSGVVISHIYGARDKESLKVAIQNAIALSIIGGAIIMVIGYFFTPYYLKLIDVPSQLQVSAEGYLRIYFFSSVSIMIYNIGAGLLRALGDSKTPLYAQLIGGIINILMNVLFIIIFNNGIYGIAWATLVSQTFAAIFILYKLSKVDKNYSLRFDKIKFDKKILKKIITIGIPAGIQSLAITFSNVMVQYQINSLGENVIAAFTVYFKVELIIYLPIVAIGQAAMIFTAQNNGARKYDRVRNGTKQCLIIGIIIAVFLSIFSLCFGRVLFRILIKEPTVIELGLNIIKITFPFYFIYVILQVLSDSLRGIGNIKEPMIIILINICIVRTILLFIIVPKFMSVNSVAIAYPITWALTSLCMVAYYLGYNKYIIKKSNI